MHSENTVLVDFRGSAPCTRDHASTPSPEHILLFRNRSKLNFKYVCFYYIILVTYFGNTPAKFVGYGITKIYVDPFWMGDGAEGDVLPILF